MNNKKALENKIDFVMFVSATNANPNGDPLNGNRPRQTLDDLGEISDVCIKRKIRNRLQDMGENIFVKMEERSDDGFKSLSERFDSAKKEWAKEKEVDEKELSKDEEKLASYACEKWLDVRSFGQVFAFKSGNVSIGVRGSVSVHQAMSVNGIDIQSIQITKSVNGDPTKDGGKSADTMGMKHFVRFGLYKIKGSINCQLAEKTGFTHDDALKIKEALKTLFENDSSSARPEGSMEVCKFYWWEHNCKTPKVTTAQVHNSVKAVCEKELPSSIDDYRFTYEKPANCDVEPEIFGIDQ